MKRVDKLERESTTPLYKQIGKHIIKRIRMGEYLPLEKIPSIYDLGQMYPEVGRVTIVAAVAYLVREGHLIAKHGLGHYVNMTNDEVTRVGLILPLFSVYLQIYAKFAAKLQMGIEKLGHRLWMLNSSERSDEFIEACDELVYKWGAKTLVVVPPYSLSNRGVVDLKSLAYLKKLASSQMVDHVIVFDRDVKDGFVSVYQDRHAGRCMLIARAAKKKMRKVLFLTDGDYKSTDKLSLVKYGQYLGVEVLFEKLSKPEKAVAAAKASGAEAVFLDSDIFATRMLDSNDGELPFQIAGYDATNYAALHTPRITSVDAGLCGGADFILRYMKGEEPEELKDFVMKPKIVVGETF